MHPSPLARPISAGAHQVILVPTEPTPEERALMEEIAALQQQMVMFSGYSAVFNIPLAGQQTTEAENASKSQR